MVCVANAGSIIQVVVTVSFCCCRCEAGTDCKVSCIHHIIVSLSSADPKVCISSKKACSTYILTEADV